MKDKSKKSTYSTIFGVDPKNLLFWRLPLLRVETTKAPALFAKKKRGKNRVYKWRALRESNPQPSDP